MQVFDNNMVSETWPPDKKPSVSQSSSVLDVLVVLAVLFVFTQPGGNGKAKFIVAPWVGTVRLPGSWPHLAQLV